MPAPNKTNKSRALTLAAACLLWAVSSAAQTNNVWFSDGSRLNVLDQATGNVLAIPLGEPAVALASDPFTDGAWLATQTHAILFAQSGQVLRSVDLASLGLHPVRAITVNPYDGSLWLADERSVLKLDRYGQPLASTQLPNPVRALHVGVDESLWALGNKLLLNVGNDGGLKGSWRLEVTEEPKFVGIDDLGGIVWVAGGRTLTQLDRQNPSVALRQIRVPYPLEGFALDEQTGTAWALAGDGLLSLGRDGMPLTNYVLSPVGVTRPYSLALDHASRSLWIGHASGAVQLALDGALLHTLATERPVSQVAATGFRLRPSVTLFHPGLDALTREPRPEFTLGLDGLCSAAPCGFAGDYLRGLALSASLDSRPIGDKFVLSEDGRQANYLPTEPLREGPNTFSAQARDRFGHPSDMIETTVTVDTIPPGFLAVEPADASMLTVNRVNVVATIDDPAGVVVLEGVGANGAAATTENSATFVYPVILLPGLNTFKLSAIDRAGNVATRLLTLNYVTARIEIEQPADGASVQGQQVIVSGTWQGPENTGVTVNGLLASLEGGRFHAAVPMAIGSNTLRAVATAPDGFSVSDSVTVTRTSGPFFVVSASSTTGAAPLEVEFIVSTSAEQAAGQVEADFDGNGTTDFTSNSPLGATAIHRFATAGTYLARFTLTGLDGQSTVESVPISVEDALKIDALLKAQWNAFTAALGARNKTLAIQYISHRQRARYEAIFDALIDDLPQIVASFSPLQWTTTSAPDPANPSQQVPWPLVSPSVGEYAVNRMVDGENQLFFIYFVRDADGVWRLDSM